MAARDSDVLSDEAQADALESFEFYEQRRDGLGNWFRGHLEIAISGIQETPELNPMQGKAPVFGSVAPHAPSLANSALQLTWASLTLNPRS